MTINQKIAHASIVLISVGILGHCLSLLKEVVVAARFGVGKEMDAFYAAITIPNLLTNILISTFIAAFIPVFVRYKGQEQGIHMKTASVVINHVLLIMTGIAVILFAFAPILIRLCFHDLAPETLMLASNILRAVSIMVVFSSLIGILGAVLNTYECFKWPALLQLSVTISTLIFLIVMGRSMGIYVLAAGLVAGTIFQFVALSLFAYAKGFRYEFSLNRSSPALMEISASALVLFLAVVSSQVNMLIDRIMASSLTEGSLSALGYADKLIQVPLIIFSGSISTAIFPYFSQQVAQNKLAEMSDSIAKSIRISAFLCIPVTMMLVILAKPIITLLFERGAFTPAATFLTYKVFVFYSFQFFFFTVAIIFYRAVLALRYNSIFLRIAFFSIFLNIALNFIFIRIFHPAVAGIALSTSVVQVVSCILLILLLAKKDIHLDWKYLCSGILKILLFSFAAGLTLIMALSWYNSHILLTSLMGKAVGITIGFASGSLVFLALSYFSRLEEVTKLINMLRQLKKTE